MEKTRLLRITTVPVSLHLLLRGQFRFMTEHDYEVMTASAAGPEIEAVKMEGAAHVVIPFTRKITPIKDLVCLLMLIRLMKSYRPQIVHTHTPKAGLLGMLAAWICRVPVRLHTVAGLPYTEARGMKAMLLKLTEQLTFFCSVRTYPNSNAMKLFLAEEFGFDDHKMSVIGKGSSNGIDTQFFRRTDALTNEAAGIRERWGIAKEDFVFCFVGRLVIDKGMTELLEAFQKLPGRVKLMLVGSFEEELSPLPAPLKKILKDDERIILVGFQTDVRAWMMASDCLTFPSYREGFPNVVMQAAALEVPVIASDISGCNELVLQEETGLLVPAKNAEALQAAMKRMMEDKALREQIKPRARAFIESNFSQSYFWNELLKEYRQFQ